MFLSSRKNKTRKCRKAVHVRRFVRRLPLSLEVLESRIMLSADNWMAGSGNWDVGSNWSLGQAPGTDDTAVINTSATATVTIQSGDAIQVQSVTTGSNDTLSITGGSLTVAAGNSTLSGALSMTGGSLTATGSGVNLTANGSTSGSETSLFAKAGSTLSLPHLTSYTAQEANGTFQADGAGSVLDLSAVTTLTLSGDWDFYATKGGTLKLNGVTSSNGGNSGGFITITDTGGSHLLLNSGLTELNHYSVTMDGTDSQLASSWTQFTFGTLTVTGGSVSLPALADIDVSDLHAQSGGSLTLPGVTSFVGGTFNGITPEPSKFSSDGTGSVLDVSALTSLAKGSVWSVSATARGTVKLASGLTGFSASDSMATADGGTLAFGNASVTMPASGNNATIAVPQLPQGIVVTLDTDFSSTFTGGTIFNIAAGDTVNIGAPAFGSPLPPADEGATFSGGTVFNAGQGSSVFLASGTFLGGTTFNVTQGAIVDLSSFANLKTTYGNTALGGPVNTSYGGILSGSGSGTVLLEGDYLSPAIGGLTLNFPGNMFQWTGGIFLATQGDVTNQGTMNLAGSNDKIVDAGGTLDNHGTIIQNGSGNLSLHNNSAALVNEAGAYYLIESDSGIDSFQQVAVQNAGTIKKTAGTGTSNLSINGLLSNPGTIEADSGTLYLNANGISQVAGNTLTAGTWNALNGSTLEFPVSTNITNNAGNVALDGNGANIPAILGLSSNSGSFSLTDGVDFNTTSDLSNSGSLTVGGGSTLFVGGNFTETSTSALNDQFGGTTGNGQFGQVDVMDAVNLAGSFNVSLANGFVPARNASYPVMSFPSANVNGTFATVTGLSPYFTEQLNGIGLTLVSGSGTSVNLQLSKVTSPTTATTGQQITVNWQVSNTGSTDATGSWQDSVFLSTTPAITGSSILLGSVTHSGGLSAGNNYNASLSAAVPPLPPGNYYVLVQADSLYQVPVADRANDTVAASTGQLAVSVPALMLGAPAHGTFTTADQDQYYQVAVPAGGSLQVMLTSATSSGSLALYVSQGTQPTPYNYQESANLVGQPNQSLNVPVTVAGAYYILVHSVSGAAATAGYSLTVTQTSALSVSAISSYSGGNAGNVTVEIDGTNFTPQTTANLTLGKTTLQATAIDFVSASQLFATFRLFGANTGGYSLSVQKGTQSATAASLFQVVAANTTPLSVTLSVPEYIRPGRTGTITIIYTNESNNDIVAPLLEIASTNPKAFFSTPDNPNGYTQDAQILAVASSGPAGILRPGQSGQLTLNLLSDDTTDDDTLPVQVSQIEPGQEMNWASQMGTLRPSSISLAAWNVIWSNLMSTVGTTANSYNTALAQAATYLGSIGESTSEVSDVNRLWGFLVSQSDDYFPLAAISSATDASLVTPGTLSLSIDRTFGSSLDERNQQGIYGQGWVTSWQTSLSVDSSGNVTIDSDGMPDFFALQPNATYHGSYGMLSLSGGIYTFTTPSGMQSVFLANGQLSYEQDTDGNRITLGYNVQNQLVTLTYSNPADPSEPTEQLTLSYYTIGPNTGLVQSVTDGTGNTWTYQYDSADHLSSVKRPGTGPSGNPGTLTTTYSYDTGSNPETANALLSVTNPDGSEQNFTYDPATGRLTGTSNNGGVNQITYTYSAGAEVTATDAAGDPFTVWYNDMGLAARVENGLGGVSTNSYDDNGNVISYTDANGDTYQYSYDSNGNLTHIVSPLGQTTQMTYGPLDTMTSITDADDNTTQYTYNSTGNLLKITYPDGTQQSFNYDPLGNLSETLLQNGDPIGYQYNAQGLVTEESFADGTSQTYTYDAHGNLLTANSYDSSGTLTGTTTQTYNAANELLSITHPGGLSLTFTYNAAGQRTQSVDQSGYTVNYSYDALGRLSELTDGSGNPIVQYTYNNLGELVKKVNGNGTYTTYAYDADGNLTQEVNYANSSGTTVNSSFIYTYNTLDEQTSMTDDAGNVTEYVYDATGQLTQVSLPAGQSITYVYNAAGDRTEVINNGTVTNYFSNSDNEITQVGSTTYKYDANGNLHQVIDASGTTTYTYNDLNQLVSITNPDGSVQNFHYSPLGFMVGTSTTSGGTTSLTNYLVDPTDLGNIVAAYNGSGSLIADYNYGLGLVSQTGPSGTGYYDFDDSGNSVGITAANGAYVNRYSYLPFGDTMTLTAQLPNPFTFVGQLGVISIGSGLFQMRARNYDPAIGQFVSNDPLGLKGGSVNIRQYTFNNPLSGTDPSGLWNQAQLINGLQEVFNFLLDPAQYLDQHNQAGTRTIICGALGFLILGGWGVSRQGLVVQAGGSAAASVVSAATKALGARLFLGGLATLVISFALFDYICPDYFKALERVFLPLFASPAEAAEIHSAISSDPNALIGPAGFGTQGFIQASGALAYTTDFENDGSAAAQVVTVTEQLDPNLGWSTFQLGSFGFGSVKVVIPAGLTQYQTVIPYENVDGTSLDVKVSLNFNVQTGSLTVTFTSIDPLTGQAPTGVFDGFLPPDNSSGIGEGFVQYTVQPKSGLANATTIGGQASVVFDTNAAIQTNTVTNAIDAMPPTSSVNALPAIVNSPSFTVSWSGSDPNGPGIASYNVYVSDNGGAFTPWLVNTTLTSATYTGQVGHTYSFDSVAADQLGLTQPTPTSAQATTYVWMPPPAPPPSPPPAPPTLQVPPLLGFLDAILGGSETINSDGTESITDSIFGIPLLVSTFNSSGGLVSVTLFGINITFLFA